MRADCLEVKLTPDRDLSMMFSGCPFALRRCLNFKRTSSNVFFFEELPLSNLITSPLMKAYFTPGGWAGGELRRLEGLGRLVMGFDHHPFHVRHSFHGRHCDDSLESLVVRFRLLRQDLMYDVPPQIFQRQTLLKLFMVATTVPTVSTLHETLQLLIEDSVAVAKSFRAR